MDPFVSNGAVTAADGTAAEADMQDPYKCGANSAAVKNAARRHPRRLHWAAEKIHGAMKGTCATTRPFTNPSPPTARTVVRLVVVARGGRAGTEDPSEQATACHRRS